MWSSNQHPMTIAVDPEVADSSTISGGVLPMTFTFLFILAQVPIENQESIQRTERTVIKSDIK